MRGLNVLTGNCTPEPDLPPTLKFAPLLSTLALPNCAQNEGDASVATVRRHMKSDHAPNGFGDEIAQYGLFEHRRKAVDQRAASRRSPGPAQSRPPSRASSVCPPI